MPGGKIRGEIKGHDEVDFRSVGAFSRRAPGGAHPHRSAQNELNLRPLAAHGYHARSLGWVTFHPFKCTERWE